MEGRATSIQNVVEATMVLSLYKELSSRYTYLENSNQIAVISPYKAQVLCLHRLKEPSRDLDGMASPSSVKSPNPESCPSPCN
jgi:superfamily I DNA and/or RNA helicase